MTLHATRRAVTIVEAPHRFRDDVVAGLSSMPKRIPSKYFYDERGSDLFERICKLDEPDHHCTCCELSPSSDGPGHCFIGRGHGVPGRGGESTRPGGPGHEPTVV